MFNLFKILIMIYAITHNDTERLKSLIENKADVNFVDEHGRHILSYTVYSNVLECAKILLEAKSDVNYKSTYPPICSAAIFDRPAFIQLFIEHDANLYVNGQPNLLRLACTNRNPTSLRLVLRVWNRDVDVVEIGETPLCRAVTHGFKDCARLLLDAGAKTRHLKTIPLWCETLVQNRNDLKHVLVHFFALSKRTKAVHKNLVTVIAKMVWERRNDVPLWGPAATKKNKQDGGA